MSRDSGKEEGRRLAFEKRKKKARRITTKRRAREEAACFVSDTPCLASAHVDEQKKCVIFRSVSTAETSWWSLGAILYRSLDDIDQSVEAFRDACSVDDDLYKLRLDELIEQGLQKELKNYPQEDYIYGTDQETND